MKLAPLALGLAAVAGLAAAVLLLLPERAPRAASAGPAPARHAVEQAGTDAEALELVSTPSANEPARVALPPDASGDAARSPRIATVSDPDGVPIAGARVELFADGDDAGGDEPLAAGVTDAAGRVSMVPAEDLPRIVRVQAGAEGFAPRTFSTGGTGPFELTLPWITAAFGLVVDEESGAPIPGATVAWGERRVEAGASGAYRIELATGARVRVEAEGYLPATIDLHADRPEPVERDLELKRSTPVRLRVFDRETGVPLTRIRLRSGEAELDPEGHLALDIAPGVELYERIEAEGYATFHLSWEVTDPGLLDGARVPMMPLSWIEGRIFGPAGEPLEGAWAYAWPDAVQDHLALDAAAQREHGLQGYVWYDSEDESVRTESDGRYRIPVLAREEGYTVTASHEGLVSRELGPVSVTQPGQRVPLDFTLTAGGRIRGTVTTNGEPWSGRVLWTSVDPSAEPTSGQTRTDYEGRYEAGGVAPGRVELRLKSSYGGPVLEASAELEVLAGESYTQDFAVELPRASISGRVVDHEGRGSPEERVSAYHATSSDGPSVHVSASTEPDGTFRVEVDPAFRYIVSAGTGQRAARLEDVAAGTDGLVLTLLETGTLRLRLLDAETGEAVHAEGSGHGVVAWRPVGEEAFRMLRPETGGRILTLELPVGRVDVLLALAEQGYAPLELRALEVVSADSPLVDARLTRGTDLFLTLAGDESIREESLRGHFVILLEQSQLDDVRGPFAQQGGPSNSRINGVCMWFRSHTLVNQLATFDPSGRAWIRGLAPGTYSLRAYPDDLAFEPASFELDGTEREVTLRWRAR